MNQHEPSLHDAICTTDTLGRDGDTARLPQPTQRINWRNH
jgi:hypothetical protein